MPSSMPPSPAEPEPNNPQRPIAVTGGSGFVGRRVITSLLEAGYRVRALQHRQPLAVPGAEVVPGNLSDAGSLARLLDGADAVIHAGALVAARRDRDFNSVNAVGTECLAAAAAKAGVPRLLLISSLAASRPALSPYAASKRAAEALLARQSGLDWDVIRPPAVYGAGDPHLLTLFRLLQRGLALLPSGRAARASLLHVDDLAAAVTAWVRAGTALRQIHELDDREPGEGASRWQEIMQHAATLLGARPRWIVPPRALLLAIGGLTQSAARSLGTAPFLTLGKVRELTAGDWIAARDARFQSQTGWRPRIGLEAGLAQVLAGYRAAGHLH